MGSGDRGRHVLVLRFTLVNVVGIGLAVGLYLQGWLDAALSGPTGWLCLAIVAVFLYGLAACALRIVRAGRALEALRGDDDGALTAALAPLSVTVHAPAALGVARLRLLGEIAIVRHVAGSLVFLGLVGTVIGFIVALSGVDPQAGADVERIGPMVAGLVRGMSIALYTTLIGSVLHLWLMVVYRMLSSGTLRLYAGLVERGAARVGP